MDRTMDAETFWEYMQEAKSLHGHDQVAFYSWMREQLLWHPSENIIRFEAIMSSYMKASYKYGLWTAAGIMMGGGCSDDGFIDFRAWLISQGRETYFNALMNPETLAAIDVRGECEFEVLGYLGSEVYRLQTGQDMNVRLLNKYIAEAEKEILPDIRYNRMIEYPLELSDAVIVYPKLCDKYLTHEIIGQEHTRMTWNTQHQDIRTLLEKGRIEIGKMKYFRKLEKKQQEECR